MINNNKKSIIIPLIFRIIIGEIICSKDEDEIDTDIVGTEDEGEAVLLTSMHSRSQSIFF